MAERWRVHTIRLALPLVAPPKVHQVIAPPPVRVHVFGGGQFLMRSRHIIRRMAQCVAGDQDIEAAEGLAAMYDETLRGDDALVGANMTLIFRTSSDPREYSERLIMASICSANARERRTEKKSLGAVHSQNQNQEMKVGPVLQGLAMASHDRSSDQNVQ